jgi:hypothetical protein
MTKAAIADLDFQGCGFRAGESGCGCGEEERDEDGELHCCCGCGWGCEVEDVLMGEITTVGVLDVFICLFLATRWHRNAAYIQTSDTSFLVRGARFLVWELS